MQFNQVSAPVAVQVCTRLSKPIETIDSEIKRLSLYPPISSPLRKIKMSLHRRRPWTSEVGFSQEDAAVSALVREFGLRSWTLVSAALVSQYALTGRSGKQCRERWHNHLNPAIRHDAWSKEEELLIVREQGQFGNRWADIAKLLPGRSDNAIKNHFYSSLRKKYRCKGRKKPAPRCEPDTSTEGSDNEAEATELLCYMQSAPRNCGLIRPLPVRLLPRHVQEEQADVTTQ